MLSWNPDNGRSLEGNLWLPQAPTPFHLVHPNTGKNDLTSFPNVDESVYQPADGIEAIDIAPEAGNYVLGANQVAPAAGSWSGAGAKVDVYRSTGSSLTLLKTCLQPSGSGSWWYAANMTLFGGSPSVTCMNSLKATFPAPYPDGPITGHVYANLSRHPLNGVLIKYETGYVITDQNGFYSIPASAGASYTLTPQTNSIHSEFLADQLNRGGRYKRNRFQRHAGRHGRKSDHRGDPGRLRLPGRQWLVIHCQYPQ